ncbi:MAG: methyltransferase domain-containing protein [Bacteroidetes bacterium]|nr:methyltransferase domain-containing protein [Bacteroidota bacterium]MBU1115711.1 methyltransferase domain-containing protein [Bacteroidota bacterium]MBU1799932.1 methyltransferase domain-containing protein [Bacteroidota bacterium]
MTIDYQKTWNDRYGGSDFLFGKKPNEYFKSKLENLQIGKLYLPGDGEGRNAVYAAQNGWDVFSVDFSDVAIKRAQNFAEEKNVKVNIGFSNLITAELPQNEYDVLGVSFLHFNDENKKIVHNKLKESIKVGGYVILECFSEEQIKLNSGGPRKKDSLYTKEELKKYYTDFEYIELEETKIVLDESDGHRGDAYVVRMFARKLK